MLQSLLVICVGGGAGAVLHFVVLIQEWFSRKLFPNLLEEVTVVVNRTQAESFSFTIDECDADFSPVMGNVCKQKHKHKSVQL